MTSEPISLSELTAADRDRIIIEARRARVLSSFAYFLTFVKTEEGPFPTDWEFQNPVISAVESNQSFIWLKRRQIMASWMMSAACVWVAMHPSHHVGVFSKDENETRELVRRMKIIVNNLPPWMGVKWNASNPLRVTTPAGESVIQPYAATSAAGVGRSFKFVLFDEFAFHPYGTENLGAVIPAVENSKGMVAITSTSNPELSQAGAMFNMWQKASTTPGNGFLPIFSPRYCRPDQSKELVDSFRDSYPNEQVYNAFYPLQPSDAFISRQGLVFGIDDDAILIFDQNENIKPKEREWGECLWRVVGIDPGGRDPSAVVPVGVWKTGDRPHLYTDRYHVYHSYHSDKAASTFDIDEILKEIDSRGRIHLVLVDPTQRMVIETLREMGWPAYPAKNDRSEILYMQDLFKRRQLTMGPGRQRIVDEIMTYEWKQDSREFIYSNSSRTSFLTRTPAWHHADSLDALRYAVVGVREFYPMIRAQGGNGWSPTVRGSGVLVKGSQVLV